MNEVLQALKEKSTDCLEAAPPRPEAPAKK